MTPRLTRQRARFAHLIATDPEGVQSRPWAFRHAVNRRLRQRRRGGTAITPWRNRDNAVTAPCRRVVEKSSFWVARKCGVGIAQVLSRTITGRMNKSLLQKPMGCLSLSEPNQNTKLISQAQVGASGTSWHRAAFDDVAARLGDPDFPCIFARNAFTKQLLKFLFVETAGSSDIRCLGEGLEDYVELSKRWDGRLDAAYPLVVAFSLDAVDARSASDYQAFGWRILQDLHDIDPAPWPEAVAKDPEVPSWSMCFNGMPLFCNMSSPAQQVRRSRNLGKHFILVINPRERFDAFAGDTPRGRNTRAKIRGRITHYDSAPPSPQLGSYGAGKLEWPQYGLVESDMTTAGTCPFAF